MRSACMVGINSESPNSVMIILDGRSATGRSFPTCHLRTFQRTFHVTETAPAVLAVIFHHSTVSSLGGNQPRNRTNSSRQLWLLAYRVS